jgi:hypothetical protein
VTPTIRRSRRVSSSRSPPSVLRSVRPLPTRRRNAGSSASSCHREGLVPPSWFLTTPTVSSGPTARALLQPAADPGVHRVSPTRAPASRTPEGAARPVSTCPFPTAHTPLEDSPCWQCLLRSPRHPKATRSREGAPSLPLYGWHRCCARCPEAPRFHSGVFSLRIRLRGFPPPAGLSPPSAVSSSRRLRPSMGFCFSLGSRRPAGRGWRRSGPVHCARQPTVERVTSKNCTEVLFSSVSTDFRVRTRKPMGRKRDQS